MGTVLTLVVLVSIIIFFLIAMYITFNPIFKNDEAWYKYEEAFEDWHKRHDYKALSSIRDDNDPMPQPEDYGWIPPSENGRN